MTSFQISRASLVEAHERDEFASFSETL
jgi:hypothetical protein